MQVLTVEGVKAAARLAYDEGRLTAQHPVQSQRICVYRTEHEGKVYGCAVGVALSDETIAIVSKKHLNGSSFMALAEGVEGGLVQCDDKFAVKRIQTNHDNWCDAERCYLDEDDQGAYIEAQRVNFLRAIDHPSVSEPAAVPAPGSVAGEG